MFGGVGRRKHFSGLLGQPTSVPDGNISIRSIHPPLNIDTELFFQNELQLAKKHLVVDVHYDDSIIPEVMKRLHIDGSILKFCNDALCDGHIPDQQKLSKIVPVPKQRKGTSQRGLLRNIRISHINSQ